MSATHRQAALQNARDSIEEPKTIWTRSRQRAFLYFLAIHFVPVATTLALFWLYLQNFQWKANDVQLKALLFASKLHESLIVISLGDILFHRIRYHLLTGRGISFGLLVSPFHVANPFSLVQTPFMASARLTLKSGPELATILLVVLVSVLALLAAPSSAALMLPRYDWWQIPSDDDAMTTFREQDMEDATYIEAPFEDLFPLLIDGRFGPNKARDDHLDIARLSDRSEQLVSGLDRVLVDGSSKANANITVVDGATVDSFALAYQEKSRDDCEPTSAQHSSRNRFAMDDIPGFICQSVAVQASSPLALVTQRLFDRYRTQTSATSSLFMITAQALDPKKGDLTWRQPSVSMQCSIVLDDGPTKLSPIHFLHWGTFPPFSISPDGPLEEEILHFMEGRDSLVARYTDITRLLPAGVGASTALLLKDGKYSNDREYFNEVPTYICLVDARWIESHVWFTAPYSTVMRSGISMESLQATTGSNTTTAISPIIDITTEYANSLDANLTIYSTYMGKPAFIDEESPFKFISSYCHARVGNPLQPKCVMLGHALYLTDSLRRTQSLFRYHSAKELRESPDLTLIEPDKWTKLDYRLYHQLHAYKFEGSIIKLSMSVLLVHMMLVYAHLLLLVVGDGWCSRAWSELGELMALAILTQPSPLLHNAGGGVKNWRTWRLRTFVREVSPEGRLELVLKEPVGSPEVLVELEEGREKVLVEPEADRRYG